MEVSIGVSFRVLRLTGILESNKKFDLNHQPRAVILHNLMMRYECLSDEPGSRDDAVFQDQLDVSACGEQRRHQGLESNISEHRDIVLEQL
jgi:hypothetical protein